MDITLTPYGMEALRRGFERAPEVARRELLVAMTEATLLLQADVQGVWPTHTGTSRASIMADAFSTPTGVLGVVESASPVVHFIELGTQGQPRKFPPLEPLIVWVADKLGLTGPQGEAAARGIQRKIGYHGTKGKFLMRDAVAKRKATVQLMFEQAAGRVALHLFDSGQGGMA